MARRDYKHRVARKERKPISPWAWLLVGFLAGAGSVGALCLKFSGPSSSSRWIGAAPPPGAVSQAPDPEVKKSRVQVPDFDFYNLLPDQEVVVPEEELARSAPNPNPATSPPPVAVESGKKYMLQVSSVRSAHEADALKAKLAFLGMRAQVSKVTIKGITWHRVRLGPYSSKSAMQQARKQLAASGYSALPIALK